MQTYYERVTDAIARHADPVAARIDGAIRDAIGHRYEVARYHELGYADGLVMGLCSALCVALDEHGERFNGPNVFNAYMGEHGC